MKRAALLCALSLLGLAAAPAGAAGFGIDSFAVRALDAEGNLESRSGSHPDRLQIDFGLNAEGTSPKDLAFEMPPGLGGLGGAVPDCPRAQYEQGEECPAESQVGKVGLTLSGGGKVTLPIFELERLPNEIVAFGSIAQFKSKLSMELRPDNVGITFTASDLPEAEISEGHLELWGVPADHQVGTSIPRRPFLTLPARCGSMTFGLRVRSHEAEAPWVSASAEAPLPLSGCQGLAFEPRLGVRLDNTRADSPTGATIEVEMPQSSDPDGLANGQVEDATIEMPEGLAISPGGAAAIVPCSDAQLGLDETTPASCPPSSRVGAMEFEALGLSDPLRGEVYLGQPVPGERIRTFVVVTGPGGLVAKSISTMHPDPLTGRLSAVLTDLPQLPLSRLVLSIDGGPHALLASPLGCGSFPAVGTFTSYGGGAPVRSSSPVAIGAGPDGSACSIPPPFAPSLTTASSVHAAGRPTAISMTLRRRPGEQLIKRFAMSLPRGLSAGLGDVDPCPDAAAASGACPPSSKVGAVVAEAGSGTSTATIHGDVYAAGAYHGAPFSIVIALHAAIGPFDLGTAATRAAVEIDPGSGRATVRSDPLPALFEGVPVRVRTIAMSLDAAGAVRNPTSCTRAEFAATIESSGGSIATAKSPLPVSRCKRLPFEPRFSISLTGRSELHRGGKPGLRISARLRRQDTNLRALRMALPSAFGFDLAGLGEICPRGDAVDGLCSARARVGVADARTALSKEPLHGSVYVVQPRGDGLPDLWISLEAGGVHVNMRSQLSLRHGRLVTDLAGLPDIQLTSFTMRLRGGEHGTLSLRAAPCAKGRSRLASRLSAKGQNGTSQRRWLRLKARCA